MGLVLPTFPLGGWRGLLHRNNNLSPGKGCSALGLESQFVPGRCVTPLPESLTGDHLDTADILGTTARTGLEYLLLDLQKLATGRLETDSLPLQVR